MADPASRKLLLAVVHDTEGTAVSRAFGLGPDDSGQPRAVCTTPTGSGTTSASSGLIRGMGRPRTPTSGCAAYRECPGFAELGDCSGRAA